MREQHLVTKDAALLSLVRSYIVLVLYRSVSPQQPMSHHLLIGCRHPPQATSLLQRQTMFQMEEAFNDPAFRMAHLLDQQAITPVRASTGTADLFAVAATMETNGEEEAVTDYSSVARVTALVSPSEQDLELIIARLHEMVEGRGETIYDLGVGADTGEVTRHLWEVLASSLEKMIQTRGMKWSMKTMKR